MTILFSSDRDDARAVDCACNHVLHYTTCTPNVDGFYWVKTKGALSGRSFETIVKVYNQCTIVFYDGENFSVNDPRFEQWAGPIPRAV